MNFQEKLKQIRELAGLDENVKSILKQMTGKELVSYEGIDALVAALMEFYNGELKKKVSITEFDEKFKNFCPIPLGGVLTMWNETNPTSLYLGTTWELISAGKYVKTGDRALQTGGSNYITLTKANLPNTKLKVDAHSHTESSHYHFVASPTAVASDYDATNVNNSNYVSAFAKDPSRNEGYILRATTNGASIGRTSNSSSTIGTSNVNTESLGSGAAFSVQPEYITLKYWKRLS